MPHPYQTEKIARTAYVMRSGEHLLELLDQSDVQDMLGTAALKLKKITEDAFVPPVTGPLRLRSDDIIGQSCIELAYELRDSDNVPIVAVRPDETLTRHPSFYYPTPRQTANAKAVKTELSLTHPAAQLEGISYRYIKESIQENDHARDQLETLELTTEEHATCQPLMLRNFHPFKDVVTTLYWRPLLVVRYDPDAPYVPLGPLAQALVQAEQVLESPAYVTEGREHESLERNWLAEAQAIGAQVARFAGE